MFFYFLHQHYKRAEGKKEEEERDMADWMIKAGKAANILEHHSFAILEHGTAIYLGKDDIGKDHDHVRNKALEFFN